MPASPVPLSASSTRSGSSVQWRLPNHRRSFSRPLLPQSVAEASDSPGRRPILTLDTVSTPSEFTFAVTTPGNPENDQYDDECSSWHQNDDSLGLAITTDNFNFEFLHPQNAEPIPKPDLATVATNLVPPPNPLARNFEFRPVKVSTLTDVSSKHTSNITKSNSKVVPMIDSAYGSLESNYSNSTGRPNRQHVKSTTSMRGTTIKHEDNAQVPCLRDPDFEVPVPEHELNMEALEVPWQDFLGAEMDEFGNVGGRSLTEYLYG